MKSNIRCYGVKILSAILVAIMLVSLMPTDGDVIYASGNQNSASRTRDKMVVVSLGDSYSSGEGIEPFYGQEKSIEDKVKDINWLAHRSTKSWPGLLEIPGIEGTLSDYWSEDTDSDICEWYFVASSGAVTKNITSDEQKKTYNLRYASKTYKDTVPIPKQLDVFSQINDSVDYVTLTVGGNDVDFSGIVTSCVVGSTYLKLSSLEKN